MLLMLGCVYSESHVDMNTMLQLADTSVGVCSEGALEHAVK